MIWSQLRRHRARALALAAGILVAATSFTLLTSTVTTSQARTTETVRKNARSAYDVLVRPHGSQTAMERRDQLVGANFLSGIFGGIETSQYERIKRMPGIEVAAPVANVGYLMVQGTLKVDLSSFVDGTAEGQLLRIKPQLTAGLGTYRAADQYLYVSRNPIEESKTLSDSTFPGLQEEHADHRTYPVCWFYNYNKTDLHVMHTDDGGLGPLKPGYIPEDRRETSPFDRDMNSWLTCRSEGARRSPRSRSPTRCCCRRWTPPPRTGWWASGRPSPPAACSPRTTSPSGVARRAGPTFPTGRSRWC